MTFKCCNEVRRAAVSANTGPINGIDYIEVLDHAATAINSPRQMTLLVHCLKVAPTTLTPDNVLIVGGESITGITAEWILPPAQLTSPLATSDEIHYFSQLPDADHILVVRTSARGDFSRYTLRLVNDAETASEDSFDITEALDGFDPQLAEVEFSFKVECGPEFDCAPTVSDCGSDLSDPPPINYLAKDYGSFRQVMLDRLNQLLPSWNGSSEADIGLMLTELVAYAGDQLSYRQDAVSTEAYLATARSRISLRRHARLVDYRVHDGCNARAWVQLNVWTGEAGAVFLDRNVTRFSTRAMGMPSIELGANTEDTMLLAGLVVFQPMHDALLFADHNQISFYTWGDANCCLPKGATGASLQGTHANLQVGDVLIFQEVMGPQTGSPADADVRHRCAVRITAMATQDAAGNTLVDPIFDIHGLAITSAGQTPMPVTEIQWSQEDALVFPVCVSSTYTDGSGKQVTLTDVSVVHGNVVLADQGLTMPSAEYGPVPQPALSYASNSSARCEIAQTQYMPVRFRPKLEESPVTQAVPLKRAGVPATSSAVSLTAQGYISLNDSNGLTSLMVAADEPPSWPQYFGLIATVNGSDPSEFDLAVIFAPPSGPAGVMGPVILERFVGLSVIEGATNDVVVRLASSNFVTVPASYVRPATVPSAFPSAPTMLSNSGTIQLEDASNVPYLLLEATPPLNWPPLFGVVTQGDLMDPDEFNLLVMYSPKSGAVGVSLPVLVEQATGVTLQNAASKLAALSNLIEVKGFSEGPNPKLSATGLMAFDASEALPVIELTTTDNGTLATWTAAQDLLSAGTSDTEFVVEVESDGTATLRFGDGTNGKLLEGGEIFTATYRIGNGTAGNVGAGSLTVLAAGPLADSLITDCTNPMPAMGGVDPETNAQIRRRAPQAFLQQERAVTLSDYIDVTEKNSQIEDAAAQLRWTGSWYTVFITAEPQGNANMSESLRRKLTRELNRYRLAGQDILIEPPQYVSLQIELSVCVIPSAFRLDVEKALKEALGSGTLANGQPALFSPKNFVLGQDVYLSRIYAAARAVAGVQTVTAKVFEPQGTKMKTYLHSGYIPMDAFQVARMDNDASMPGNGQLRLRMRGGR